MTSSRPSRSRRSTIEERDKPRRKGVPSAVHQRPPVVQVTAASGAANVAATTSANGRSIGSLVDELR